MLKHHHMAGSAILIHSEAVDSKIANILPLCRIVRYNIHRGAFVERILEHNININTNVSVN